MIIPEIVIIGNKEYIKRYSDKGLKIKQVETGEVYDDAFDLVPCKFTYVETDKPVEKEEKENDE